MTFFRRFLSKPGRQAQPVPDAPVQPAYPLPNYRGYIEQLSRFHAEGWMQNRADLAERTAFIVRRADSGETIAQGRADHFRYGLSEAGVGDGGHGFHVRFAAPLPEAALAQVEIVPIPGGTAIPAAPKLSRAYEPMCLVSMDIVDNCNLRCPFCVFDYSETRTTNMMDEATIDAALRFLPYVTDGNFWFSCLHEPTLHPEFMRFVDKVPPQWRKKIFFTTNLAKRMPPAYFDWLVATDLHHINISIESLVPEVYERMRKGARFRIFMENWDALMAAMSRHHAPAPIRYIAMVYRSNYRELPGLVSHLLEERRGTHVELRFTFDVPHLPKDFRDAEFLDPEGWLWLRNQLKGYSAEQVVLILPPGVRPETPRLEIDLAERFDPIPLHAPQSGVRHFLPGRYQSRLSWDGTFKVSQFWIHPYEEGPHQVPLPEVNIRDIHDPLSFLAEMSDILRAREVASAQTSA